MKACARTVRGLLALVALTAVVAGLPWALAHFVGWPLPDHVPTWDEIQATLISPMGSQFFVDLLAVVCWGAWICFVFDVLRTAVDFARGVTWSRTRGPLHALGAALVGAVVVTLLSNRALASSSAAAQDVRSVPPAAVASLTPSPAALPAAATSTAALQVDHAAPAPPGLVRVIDEVRPPQKGTYDSLWRVAERVYGSGGGGRWPELFELNRGVEQEDGRYLSDPDLVRPGWKIAAYVPEPAEDQLPQEVPPPAIVVPTPPASAPVEQAVGSRDQAEPGLDLMPGLYVSAGLAGAISAVMVVRQFRHRRRYRIGSGERSDLQQPVAPVVRALRLACPADLDVQNDIELVCSGSAQPQVPTSAGVRKGQEFALDLASTRGLGLAGPGAASAARALLLHMLTARQKHEGLRVLVPADDLHRLFEGQEAPELPSGVEVFVSLDTALDEMEAALLTRVRHALEEFQSVAPVVLVASSAAHAERRLQAVLDNGSTLGLAGILLGQWRPGATIAVRADGTVSATSPGLGDELAAARLFTVPAADTADLLAVLREAAADQANEELEEQEARPFSELAVPDQRTSRSAELRPRLIMKVFGRFELTFAQASREDRELSVLLTPKQREVLVHLALHSQGVRREALNEAVWPGSRPPRPYNSFHNTLSVLRRTLSEATGGVMTNVIINGGGRYQLNDESVAVDVWEFQLLLEGTDLADVDRTTRLHRVVELYKGEFAEDLLAPWAEPFRESARRDVLDALSALIREHDEADVETVLALLERARKLDQYNEGIYRDIMRAQARLGQHTAVPRTLGLLTKILSEIDEKPTTDTVRLTELLQRHSSGAQLASASHRPAS